MYTITPIFTQNGEKLEFRCDPPKNMTATKFHKIIKKIGGKIEGRVYVFENKNSNLLEQTLLNNGLITN